MFHVNKVVGVYAFDMFWHKIRMLCSIMDVLLVEFEMLVRSKSSNNCCQQLEINEKTAFVRITILTLEVIEME